MPSVTTKEVTRSLSKVKSCKLSGPKIIPGWAVMDCTHHIFNTSISKASEPPYLKTATIIPVPKTSTNDSDVSGRTDADSHEALLKPGHDLWYWWLHGPSLRCLQEVENYQWFTSPTPIYRRGTLIPDCLSLISGLPSRPSSHKPLVNKLAALIRSYLCIKAQDL